MKRIIVYVFRLLNYKLKFTFLSIVNALIPKTQNLVFIYDKRGRRDNVWAIARFISEHELISKYKVYYYTQKPLREINNIVFISNGLHALLLQLRATYVFFSYTDITKIKPCKNQIVLDTMHGSPAKRMGYLASKTRFGKFWKYESTFTHILCVSDFFGGIIRRSFGASEEQCIVLGYPRNDIIFDKNKVLHKLGIVRDSYKKVILWMPTWRKANNSLSRKGYDNFFPLLNLDSIAILQEYLKKENLLVIIKPHPSQVQLPLFEQKMKNIIIIMNEDLEKSDVFLYELFYESDALLTDYSSVYFDYLLTMKPIGFTIDDFEKYDNSTGFTDEKILDIMPGDKIKNIEQLIMFFEDIKNGIDKYYGERVRVNNLANKYQDGNSTKRLIEYLKM
ncbi:MAG: CDP-glycerol glycerophosphotransferase family protein [Bacilli bacterium]|nr:CDP-glycerol glycerophosphotransferase family protein [Bacilli bacterium]